jgi:hypothetical protein
MTGTKILMVVGLFLVLIVLMPYAAIWSLNTLFALTIPFTFDTWCAAVVLSGIVSGNHFVTFKK